MEAALFCVEIEDGERATDLLEMTGGELTAESEVKVINDIIRFCSVGKELLNYHLMLSDNVYKSDRAREVGRYFHYARSGAGVMFSDLDWINPEDAEILDWISIQFDEQFFTYAGNQKAELS